MKNNWPVKKLGVVFVGIIFLVFASAFFVKEQYWQSLITIALLIILLKIDMLRKFILNSKSGFETEFAIPEENIKKDIEENKEPVTRKNYIRFKKVEEKILDTVHGSLGGTMKKQTHFMYGMPNHPQFMYTPDATIQTEKELILIEIKYILKAELAKDIIKKTTNYLKQVYDAFAASAGKKLIMKLILASGHDIDTSSFALPDGIDVEFIKV